MTRVFNDPSQRMHVTGSRDADKASFTGRVHRDSEGTSLSDRIVQMHFTELATSGNIRMRSQSYGK